MSLPAQQNRPQIPPEAIQRGRAQFAQSCAFCHGPSAAGGTHGPSLIRSAVVRHDENGNLIGKVIREGRPDQGMPPIPLSPNQVADIVAFLASRIAASDIRSAGRPVRGSSDKLLTGNAEAGRVFFQGTGGCAGCHSPAGDLAGVGRKYAAADLQTRLLYPPRKRMTATVTDAAGKQYTGEILLLTNYDVAIQDAGGWYHSWPLGAVKLDVKNPLAAHRDLLTKYTDSDMHNTGLPGDPKVSKLAMALAVTACLRAQGLDPAALLKPPTDTWPSYNGDYTGRRYSTLSQINQSNAGSLAMAWAFQTHQQAIKSTPLVVNGILYFTVPNHVWAVDARTGRQVWHFQRQSGGNLIGQRGVAMYKDRLYFGTPDAHLICLDARNGKQVWDVEVADYRFGYYISVTPLVVKDRLITGMSNDQSDIPGFLDARSLEDGKILWHWDAVPKPGQPGAETWPNADAMAHGGGATWIPGSYDPELNLIYWGTGNPHPVLAGKVRPGANLYTCSIVALNADTGKLVWYFQASPHDTQDRDANESVVLIDADFKGKPRKLLAQASRNGYYFVLDRLTGENLLSAEFGPQNWSAGLNSRGEPIPKPDKEPQISGALFEGSGTNWWSPSYSPDTGLFYVNAHHHFMVSYLTLDDQDEQKASDHQGGANTTLWSQSMLLALDFETGKVRWRQDRPAGGGGSDQGSGILTTAGRLLFTGDSTGNLVALDAATGKTLWHIYPGGSLTGAPMTYELSGRQYVITAVDSVLYAWALPAR